MPAPERSLSVWLREQRVGTLHARGDQIRFVLDDAYVANPRREVLGLRFEEDLYARHRSIRRLPPWFSNLLPEGRLRQWIADARGVHETLELELLSEVGHDLPGAVRVTDDADSLVSDRATAREVVTNKANVEEYRNVWRFSLAGVAMKLSMLQRGERFTAPAVGEGGDWIVKLPDAVYPDVPMNEFATMELARKAGIEVPETRMVHRDELDDVPEDFWPTGEVLAYAVRRFDRTKDKGLVHMEDLAQVRGFYPEDKYSGSFETVGALVYRGHDTRSILEFARRLAFVVLVRNGDAHLKNWSLLYEDPRLPRLAPAYDMVSTAMYQPAGRTEDLGLKFGESRRFESVSLARFERLQRKLGLTHVSLVDEVRNVVERTRAAWPEIAEFLRDHPSLCKGIGDELGARAAFLLRA
ncbi:type II toxin-antitoxin system HipA family toxin [Paraliomyxa miuraensis]|uniref:type II toxin-antitoxin system HipA family toxin n=1 Tax=Paraliomyxa miuraensis TaxID=376150 RepID=UPI0022512063|nr:type II toxin-antitoxin system HipA family toxin [Paraliomyxa miuraensis]MCX4240893.1 type II toxin-antitoxin system HipA family toxin [Paraliomyxa miuraensis]